MAAETDPRRRVNLNDSTGAASVAADIVSYEVEVIRDAAGMLSLHKEWDRLSTVCPQPNVFSTFVWFWSWWNYVAPRLSRLPERLHILLVRRKGAITAIFPLMMRLVRRGRLSFRKLEFIGGDDLSDYQAALFAFDPEGQARAVVDHLVSTRDQWDILELHNLAAESAEDLRHAFERELTVRVASGEDCFFFAIEGPWNTITQRATKLTRQTLRNQANRLEREGIRVRIVEHPEGEVDLLDRMSAFERRKVIRGGPGDNLLSRWPEFFQCLFKELGPKGWIGVALMEKGYELIAYNLFFRCGASIWDYTKAYDPAFAKLSPGTMLLPVIVDYAYAHGYGEYDFLRGAETYKMKWATGVRTTCHLQAWHGGLRSRFAALAYFSIHRPIFRYLARIRGNA